MPWKETCPVEERLKFIAAYLEEDESFVELCERFEISRNKGYKWVERYEEGGVEALRDRSRRPFSNSRAVVASTVELLVSARKKHPRWGPRKLIAVLVREYPELILPAASTVGEILHRNGLVKKRRRKRSSTGYGQKLGGYDAPNAIWCADFKGWFCIDHRPCHPLTLSDGFSRYLLRCIALRRTLTAPVRRGFESAFTEFGLPLAIRTDNGPPFVSVTTGGLSRLSVWWIKLGIRPERILPGRPDQNGRHERMHRTLKDEATKPAQPTFPAQQRVFDRFRSEFNEIRPHEALGQKTPASQYQPSPRPFPCKLEDPSYPDHFHVQRAYPNGVITFERTQWYLSGCLARELIGVESIADGCWKVYFGPVPLGLIDLRRSVLRNTRNFGLLLRLPDDPRRRRPLTRRTGGSQLLLSDRKNHHSGSAARGAAGSGL